LDELKAAMTAALVLAAEGHTVLLFCWQFVLLFVLRSLAFFCQAEHWMDNLRKFTMSNVFFLLRNYACACVFFLVFLLPLNQTCMWCVFILYFYFHSIKPGNKDPLIIISLIKAGQLQPQLCPQLFAGQNRPVAAAATGKHRHGFAGCGNWSCSRIGSLAERLAAAAAATAAAALCWLRQS
jgi:hypothetical protein